ncbi:CLUMA_CG020963, isoform A [Clunio marinus]|uniref:CLUMA_CG020963, isoform A n=1 Tax=Clunio marinus TaxID=568069 RepID=A0A1J1J8C9_9DIPT|nr:CLUMA_CG020963, isoform A [Clunio marinus]
MGFKVNTFAFSSLFIGMLLPGYNMKSLFLILGAFILIYMNFKVWKYTRKFPGRNYFLPEWNTFFAYNSFTFHNELFKKWLNFGRDKFIIWIGFERYLTLSKLRDVKNVFDVTNDAPLMENYYQMWPWLGGDETVKNNEFSSDALVKALTDDASIETLTKSDIFIEAIKKQTELISEQSGGVIDVQPPIRALTFNVVCGIAMGFKSESRQHEIFEAAEKLCQMVDQRICSGWKQYKWLSNVLGEESKMLKQKSILTEWVKMVLQTKRDNRDQNVSCLLDALVANRSLTQDEIVSTIVGFIVLGYDRLASATCSALLELSKQVEVQEKIRKEIRNNAIISTNTSQLLETFLMETQRLYPSVSVVNKWITVGIPLNGFFIPPNSSVLLYLYGIGHDAQRFSNPDECDIYRMNLAETYGINRHEFSMPMTVIKVLVGNLLKKYQLREGKDKVEIGSGLALRMSGVRISIKSL